MRARLFLVIVSKQVNGVIATESIAAPVSVIQLSSKWQHLYAIFADADDFALGCPVRQTARSTKPAYQP